jgi:hypothetical protein
VSVVAYATEAEHWYWCGRALYRADLLVYSDLMAGREMAKVRSVCTAGHSVWEVVDLGPVAGREVKPFAPRRLVASASAPPPPRLERCPRCNRMMPPFHRVRCRGGAGRQRWDRERAEQFAARWNGGDSTLQMAARFGLTVRSVSSYVGALARRYPDLGWVRRQHGGRRETVRA